MSDTTDISGNLFDTINSIFASIFSSVDNKIYEALDDVAFIKPGILFQTPFLKIFGESAFEGMLLVANSLVAGFVLIYVVTYLFSHVTNAKVQNPVQFILKTIIFVAIMNNSRWICSEIINIVSLISKAICEIGSNVLGQEISFSNFITQINNIMYSTQTSIEITSFDGIIKTFVTIGFMNLIFSYALRYIMIQVFILIFPIGILTLINTKTEWIFKSIGKAFISLLFEQVLISLILLLAFSFSFSNSDTMSKILYIGIIYALMKTNTYMYMIFGGISTSISNGIGMLSGRITQ